MDESAEPERRKEGRMRSSLGQTYEPGLADEQKAV
jgi:hypothetical protein